MERKSLYDLSWKVSEEEYRADPAYSYSTIARFNREGFDNLDKLYDKVENDRFRHTLRSIFRLPPSQAENSRRYGI